MKSKPTVLVVRSMPVGHAGRMQNTLRMLREAGFEARGYCWDRLGERPRDEECNGCAVHNCGVKGAFSSKMLFLCIPVWWVWEFFYLLTHRVDCIIAADLDTVAPALFMKYLWGSKLVFDIYDSYAAKATAIPKVLYPLFNAAERFCARRADIVVMPDAARSYTLGEPLPKRLVIVENSHYDELDPTWEKGDHEDFVVFYAGTLDAYRGMQKLIELTADLEGIRLIVAGRIQDEALQKAVDKAPHVEFLGFIPPDEVLRRTFDADAVYSYYDPALEINRTANSTKMFEAFMCGTPVMTNSEPPSTEIVKDFGCGSRLPYADDEGLRNTIIAWRDDRELAREAGRNARRAFEERFNWEAGSRPLLEAFREIGLMEV